MGARREKPSGGSAAVGGFAGAGFHHIKQTVIEAEGVGDAPFEAGVGRSGCGGKGGDVAAGMSSGGQEVGHDDDAAGALTGTRGEGGGEVGLGEFHVSDFDDRVGVSETKALGEAVEEAIGLIESAAVIDEYEGGGGAG